MPEFLLGNVKNVTREKLIDRQIRQKHFYDSRPRDVPDFKKGDNVKVKSRNGSQDSARIVELSNEPRYYIVEMKTGLEIDFT